MSCMPTKRLRYQPLSVDHAVAPDQSSCQTQPILDAMDALMLDIQGHIERLDTDIAACCDMMGSSAAALHEIPLFPDALRDSLPIGSLEAAASDLTLHVDLLQSQKDLMQTLNSQVVGKRAEFLALGDALCMDAALASLMLIRDAYLASADPAN